MNEKREKCSCKARKMYRLCKVCKANTNNVKFHFKTGKKNIMVAVITSEMTFLMFVGGGNSR